MPAYDYRCTTCGVELEIIHRMSETIAEREHTDPSGTACSGALERLISAAGLAKSVGTKPPSDAQLKSAGFKKLVKGKNGYENVLK
jgi:putative FmdB family regulatory protein